MNANAAIVTTIYLLAWIPMVGITVEYWSTLPHLIKVAMLGMVLWYPVLWWMFAKRKFADKDMAGAVCCVLISANGMIGLLLHKP